MEVDLSFELELRFWEDAVVNFDPTYIPSNSRKSSPRLLFDNDRLRHSALSKLGVDIGIGGGHTVFALYPVVYWTSMVAVFLYGATEADNYGASSWKKSWRCK